MDADRFDALLAALTAAPSRRAALRLLGGLGLAGLVGQTDAKKKHKKKKCAKAGQPTSKKRKQCCAGLVKDATGRCAPAARRRRLRAAHLSRQRLRQPAGWVWRDAELRRCPANQICLRSGVCQPCTVTCTGTPATCGTALQTAMDGGGTIYVCPGRYQGGFTLSDCRDRHRRGGGRRAGQQHHPRCQWGGTGAVDQRGGGAGRAGTAAPHRRHRRC